MNRGEKPPHARAMKFLTGPLIGAIFPLDKPSTTIGCDPGNDLVIPNDRGIAAFHVRLFWKDATLYIEKHPQAGKLMVNKRPVEQSPLSADALIELSEDTCC